MEIPINIVGNINNKFITKAEIIDQDSESLVCTSPPVLVMISIAVKRHQDTDNSYKSKHLIVVTDSSKVQSIIIMGYGGAQADIVLKKELRVLTS